MRHVAQHNQSLSTQRSASTQCVVLACSFEARYYYYAGPA